MYIHTRCRKGERERREGAGSGGRVLWLPVCYSALVMLTLTKTDQISKLTCKGKDGEKEKRFPKL